MGRKKSIVTDQQQVGNIDIFDIEEQFNKILNEQ